MRDRSCSTNALQRVLLFATLTVLFSSLSIAAAEKRRFDIAAGEARSTLNEFSRQAELQIYFDIDSVRSVVTRAVAGEFAAADALSEMLGGTQLEFEFVNDRTVAVMRREEHRLSTVGALNDETNADSVRRSASFTSSRELIRISKANGGTAGRDPVRDRDRRQENAAQRGADEFDTVVITGTHIRGIKNRTVPSLTIDRLEIDRSGVSSTQQLMRNLPQNFSGGQNGPSEDGQFTLGSNRAANISSGTGVNLRGLGTTSTLVLINGHRTAPAARGTAVDVSLIPLSAIEKVDVLTDGASAVYGSDAIAGVVNFVLRSDFDGLETGVRYGSVTDGGTDELSANQLLGHAWSTGNGLLSAQYRRREALPTADRDFSIGASQPSDLLPDIEEKSVLLSARQAVADRVGVFADGLYTRKSADRQQSTTVSSNQLLAMIDRLNAAAGVNYDVAGDWRVALTGGYSLEDDETLGWYRRGAPAGYINGNTLNNDTFELWSADLQFDGTLVDLRGRPLRAALGIGSRDERFVGRRPWRSMREASQRSIRAAYLEFYVPLIGETNERRFLRRLDLSAAVRHERYSDFGDTTNPRVGLFWSPSESWALKSAFSTSFRAPTAHEALRTDLGVTNFLFARPGGGTVPVLILTGSNRALQPEEAENLTLALEYSPPSIENVVLSLGYYDIDFTDRITAAPFDRNALLNPGIYGPLITPFASDAEAQAYLQDQISRGALFTDALRVGTTGVRAAYDIRQQNAARVRQSGFDALIRYRYDFGRNTLGTDLNLSVIREIRTSFTQTSIPTDTVDTYGNPLQHRARGSLSWTRANWQVAGYVNWSGSYQDTTVSPPSRVDAWTTADLSARYASSPSGGLTVGLSIQNLFDSDPPTTGSVFPGVFYDVANGDPLGRMVSVELRKSW